MRPPHRSNFSGVLVRVRRLALTVLALAALTAAGAPPVAAGPGVAPASEARVQEPAFVDMVAVGPERVVLLTEGGVSVSSGVVRGEAWFSGSGDLAGGSDLAATREGDDALVALPTEHAVQRYDLMDGPGQRWDLAAGLCPTRVADLGPALLVALRCEGEPTSRLAVLDPAGAQVVGVPGDWQEPELVPDAVDATAVHVVETAAGAGRAVRYRLDTASGGLLEEARRTLPGRVVDVVSDEQQGGRLLVASTGPDALVTLAADTLQETGRTAVPGIRNLAADGGLTAVAHGDTVTLMAPGYRAPQHVPRPVSERGLGLVVRDGTFHRAVLGRADGGLRVDRGSARFGAQVRLSSTEVGPYTSPEWGHPVTFDVGLNSLALDRTVEVYAVTDGVRRLLGRVEVQPGRTAGLTTRLRESTDVEAVFAGGAQHDPASARLPVSLRTALSTRLSGHVGRRGRTHLYRVGSVAVTHTRVGPARDGRCVRHQAQYLDRGVWETFSRTSCLRTDARGLVVSRLGSNESYLGHRIRIQIEVGSDRLTQGNGVVVHLRYLPAGRR